MHAISYNVRRKKTFYGELSLGSDWSVYCLSEHLSDIYSWNQNDTWKCRHMSHRAPPLPIKRSITASYSQLTSLLSCFAALQEVDGLQSLADRVACCVNTQWEAVADNERRTSGQLNKLSRRTGGAWLMTVCTECVVLGRLTWVSVTNIITSIFVKIQMTLQLKMRRHAEFSYQELEPLSFWFWCELRGHGNDLIVSDNDCPADIHRKRWK